MALLQVEEITAGYVEEIDVLRDVSFEIEEGTITGIIGANGAGKSTLLKTIFGFLHPRKGRIVFDGSEIQSNEPYQMKQMGMSYILQEYSIFPELSVHDNLLLGAWTFRRDATRLRQRLDEIYRFFPILRQRRSENATYLSGGQLRLLSLGKEIMSQPKLLLIDEPSVGLQPNIVTEIYEFLKLIAEQGTTIVIVDQNIKKAFEISEYMMMLDMGRITEEGQKKDFEKHIREMIKVTLMRS
ncbi:MAG: ABC transporter ATP-binding protein [Spirochaetales bacterium]|nr:ABC transporter ATP-binding protein [Spirochaetales bacterium]